MGSAAAFNIEADVSENIASDIATIVAEEYGFEETSNTDQLEYRFEVPDRIDSGNMSTSNDSLWMRYGEGSEYNGASKKKTFTVHYSPYYTENMETLQMKLDVLEEIKETVSEVTPEGIDVDYYVSSCTI